MAIKKSDLYSSLWASCDALRGGMDASQYKDYVLVMLFLKYVSDKAGSENTLIEVPKGCSFNDIAKLKGKKDIGEQIDIAIGALAKANNLEKVIDVVSFNDEEKLGKGNEMVDTLSKLVSIFENPGLDFQNNKAEGDDILGDAYEYLMRNFATESGKSKGQFYTPAEVSRIMAKVINVNKATSSSQTVYDPTCGSGSLLLKAAEESGLELTLYGQEKEGSTAALAMMNMILHNNATAEIKKGQSTLSNPLFLNEHGYMMSFDYVVANPPFSLKNWTQGFNPSEDEHDRFTGYGVPPEKNGDYAFLIHIIKSLKSKGKGGVILPHGVLFRGGAEGTIRKNIITRGLIKGIIGLPANLFYGTGIPACIIVIDKEGADDRKGIFMIDASKGYIKDGNKNRLREQDLHKIVDVFNKQVEVPKYSRFVLNEEITDARNDYNLNIPRYIDSQEAEDIQDIEAHLLGDIPVADIDALGEYWAAYTSLKDHLFGKSKRNGYMVPKFEQDKVKETIFTHPEFEAFSAKMGEVFAKWHQNTSEYLKGLNIACKPKQVISDIAEELLKAYTDKQLLDKYDIYQHLLNYWNEVMQDDCYLVAADGWVAEPYRIMKKNKKGGQDDKGWACDLVPRNLIIDVYFATDKVAIEEMEADKEAAIAEMTVMEEEYGGEDGYFAEFDKITKAAIESRLKEISKKKDDQDEVSVLKKYLELYNKEAALSGKNGKIKTAEVELDNNAYNQCKQLTEEDIKHLVVEHKWMKAVEGRILGEMERISQRLTQRIKELATRYGTPLPAINQQVKELEEKVNAHLAKMGFSWN